MEIVNFEKFLHNCITEDARAAVDNAIYYANKDIDEFIEHLNYAIDAWTDSIRELRLIMRKIKSQVN